MDRFCVQCSLCDNFSHQQAMGGHDMAANTLLGLLFKYALITDLEYLKALDMVAK